MHVYVEFVEHVISYVAVVVIYCMLYVHIYNLVNEETLYGYIANKSLLLLLLLHYYYYYYDYIQNNNLAYKLIFQKYAQSLD